jgi:hypothetical protein
MLEEYYNAETKTLTIPEYFRGELENIPKDTESIIFQEYIHSALEGESIRISYFNRPIDNLPPNLKHLSLGTCFNQPIDSLPPSLIHLTIGMRFNQPVDSLPSNLTHLILGSDFNHQINNLPPKLIHLDVGKTFFQPMDNLPPSVQEIHIDNNNYWIKHMKIKVPFGCKIYNNKNEEVFL